jgi:hypothetical protein
MGVNQSLEILIVAECTAAEKTNSVSKGILEG